MEVQLAYGIIEDKEMMERLPKHSPLMFHSFMRIVLD